MWLVGLLSGTFAGALIGKLIGTAWVGPVALLGGVFGLAIGLIAGAGRRSAAPEGAEQRIQLLEKKVVWLYEETQKLRDVIVELEAKIPATSAAPAVFVDETPTRPGYDFEPSVSVAERIDASQRALEAAEPLAQPSPLREPADRLEIVLPLLEPVAPTSEVATPLHVQAAAAPVQDESVPTPTPRRPRPPAAPAEPSFFQTILQRWVFGGNPVVKIGVVLLFLGFAFLLRYAAEHAVLPVELRYAAVAASAIGLLLFGWRWRGREDNYGLILQGGGVGVLYLTTLAAMRLHPLLPLSFGFAILIGVAAFAALLAILQDSLVLAVIATLGGFAAPVLASSGSGSHVALFSYLALLNGGILAIAWFKAWRPLNLIGFIGTLLMAGAWADKYYRPDLYSTTEPFLLLFFVVYVLITFLFARRTLAEADDLEEDDAEELVRQSVRQVSYVDGSLAFGVPLAAFGMQCLLVKPFEYGAAFSALGFGLVYLVLAFVLFFRSGARYYLLTETMIALGVIFGSLAIPLGLEQGWTSAAWAVEAAGVYWIGIRQQRLHARLFALLLLCGSALYFAPGVHFAVQGQMQGPAQGAVLDGSLLGSFLLAAGFGWTCRLMRLAGEEVVSALEIMLRPILVALGAFFVALMPFLLWPMDWASPALALLGMLAIFFALRIGERSLLYWGLLYQLLAGGLFMTTLHAAHGGSVLTSGWTGLFAASLIGASLLAGFWAINRRANTDDDADENSDESPPPSGLTSVAMLAGLAFINLAPLFVLPLRQAALVWPLTGIVTLWWALRAGHVAAVLFALALQALAGVAYLSGSGLWHHHGADATLALAQPFLHSGFLGPLLIALAALVCARLLQREESSSGDVALGWIVLFWGVAWWGWAWSEEIARVAPADARTACLLAFALASAALWSRVAARYQWPQLGLTTLLYLPVLAAIAASAWQSGISHPLQGWAALVWPLALLMHGLLLRRQSAWVAPAMLDLAHIVGAWLFVILAAFELRWQLAQWGDAHSAWPLLGWMIAPVAYLWILTSTRLQRGWPLREHYRAYVVLSALPILLYLFAWVWLSNLRSDGAALPLPYVPLLNPLEMAQSAVLLGAMVWWRALPDDEGWRGSWPLTVGITAVTGFAVLTGMVVRTCHHWGNVPWNEGALMASNLVQTSLSIVWSLLAIGLMLLGNRRLQRAIWIVGAVLMAVVVAKLFLVELSATGSLERIVSFIVVGLLLLLVGYFAPLPPKNADDFEAAEEVSP